MVKHASRVSLVFCTFWLGRLWSNHVCSSENNISFAPVSFSSKLLPATSLTLKYVDIFQEKILR